MAKKKNRDSFGRRDFIKIVATAAFSGPILLSTAYSKSNESTRTKETIHRNEQPTMTYRKLGRTGKVCCKVLDGTNGCEPERPADRQCGRILPDGRR